MPRPYDPRAAWRRAFTYFACCWVAALVSGALATLPGPVLLDDVGWVVWTLGAYVVVVVGYWVVWPMGTRTHGRPLRVGAVLRFGLAWGVSEGLLFVAVWTVAERWLGWGVALAATMLVMGTFLGLWHARYWDLKVAPEHNIESWNLRKVLLVHVPNLAVTVPYLATYGSAAVFVGCQAVGLLGATWAMHVPPPARANAFTPGTPGGSAGPG